MFENVAILLSVLIKDKFKFSYEEINESMLQHYYEELRKMAAKLGITSKSIYLNISESLGLMCIILLA